MNNGTTTTTRSPSPGDHDRLVGGDWDTMRGPSLPVPDGWIIADRTEDEGRYAIAGDGITMRKVRNPIEWHRRGLCRRIVGGRNPCRCPRCASHPCTVRHN